MKNRNLIGSFDTAIQGIWYCIKSERNIKIHMAVTIAVLILAALLGVNNTEFAVLCLTCGLVICFELINTAIEVIVDIIVDVYHPKAKIIKDVSAGAVLVASFFSVIIGIAILSGKLLHYFGG